MSASSTVWTALAAVTNAGCRAFPQDTDEPVVVDVVVPASVAEQVVAEAEVLCAAEAVVAEAATRFATVRAALACQGGW